MSAAGWGLLGTLVGGLVTITGNLVLHWFDSSDRQHQEKLRAADRAREERKAAYLRLLTAARRLRYLARPGATRDAEALDNLRAELSSVNFEIELISSASVASQADAVRRKTLDYLNGSVGEAASGAPTQTPEQVEGLRLSAQAAVDEFIEAAQVDLGLASRV